MHAARAVHKQREKREEKAKLDVRRASAASQYSRRVSRSPAVSVDTSARKSHSHNDDEPDNLNFSYIGFIIAVFGAVPLIVGTFIEVPALWEIGLGVTLVGLFIGVVFWCTELCAEAKRFSQKKNQLSTRGKIEDSNLLHVPERKFGSGMDSRRGSFQSDSVSLISPAVVHHYTPKHHPDLLHLAHNPGSRNSISQFSSDFSTSSGRANGHLVPPALMLRSNGRRDDGRVVSLVQPDPGLDDDSDSDAETVIEAPTSHHSNTKVIQVQTCQEKQQQHLLHHHLKRPLLGTAFNIENEKISPLMHQHLTIRMPVMPQEVDKLQRCECGRYLLTERDKLIGIRLPGIEDSDSESPTTSNSPIPASALPVPEGKSVSAPRNNTMHGNFGLNTDELGDDGQTASGSNVTTPLADQLPPPPPHKIISVNPSVKIAPTIPATPQNSSASGNTNVIVESTVQVDPVLSSSIQKDLLEVTSGEKKTEDLEVDVDDDGDVTPGNESNGAFQETAVVVEEKEEDKILSELLELTDINDEDMEEKRPEQMSMEVANAVIVSDNETQDAETKQSVITDGETSTEQQLSREGSRRRLQYQSQVTSISRPRPTSLPLLASISFDAEAADSSVHKNVVAESGIPIQKDSSGRESTAATQADEGQQIRIHSGELRENKPNLPDDLSLDELLDSLEKNQEGEVLAVVVQ